MSKYRCIFSVISEFISDIFVIQNAILAYEFKIFGHFDRIVYLFSVIHQKFGSNDKKKKRKLAGQLAINCYKFSFKLKSMIWL